MSELFERLLKVRGLGHDFLDVKYEELADPFLLPDMAKAVERIKCAIKKREKILIFGDYDVDGVTASTVMEDALKLAGAEQKNLDIMLPNRFTDGYGMSPRMVKYAKERGVELVITVDCGSRSHEIIEELKKLQIDTIVTDHHETGETLPEAIAVVNAKRKDFHPVGGLENLAGVGVAFKVAEALARSGLIPNKQERWLLDLVVIGTICDSMVLTEENRILCFYGLKVLAKTRRPGLKELIRLARVKTLNSETIGFQIGPRLNAAGRLKDAGLALELLRTNSPPEAARLAAELEELNKRRRAEQQAAVKEIKARRVADSALDPVMVEVGNYHEGILGIIAGHLTEDYARPSFVLSEVEEGVLKGSGRSFGDFNLAEALKAVEDVIIGGGGHAGAAGVKLAKNKLGEFREGLNVYYASLGLKDQARFLKSAPDLVLRDFAGFDLNFLDELKTLEPLGVGNAEPIFRLEGAQITGVTRMGAEKNHLRLDLRDEAGRNLKALSFYAPEKWLKLEAGTEANLLVNLMENDFNGVKSLEARICDIAL